ncbi:uncharacterized protein N7506_005297 [Penicillium brevicompactum]|uniref:uncharacterized protein n=1 Tax=Penicillium brevicompactum TaxID=5074 RepID=UPI0025421F6F|nr:uncharacterized protein N7506_005297 [Penicillium brevicompactum]KAJ5337275.1 hypothetical protein N7506_005297 [Penicillium brevicompactum]
MSMRLYHHRILKLLPIAVLAARDVRLKPTDAKDYPSDEENTKLTGKLIGCDCQSVALGRPRRM